MRRAALVAFLVFCAVAVADDEIRIQAVADGNTYHVTLAGGDVLHVPKDDLRNRHLRAVLQWIAAGGSVTPAPNMTSDQRTRRRESYYAAMSRLMAIRQAAIEHPLDPALTSDRTAAQAMVDALYEETK